MAKASVLVEVETTVPNALSAHAAATEDVAVAAIQAEGLVQNLSGLGLEVVSEFPPVPLFSPEIVRAPTGGFADFASPTTNPDVPAASVVVAAVIERSRIPDLTRRPGVRVYENSPLVLFGPDEQSVFNLVGPAGGVDCRPFRDPVSVWTIRTLLGVRPIWRDGFRGQGIVVGIIDEGIDGGVYPVVGGYSNPNAQPPGAAPITSHGSMCAADVLVAAPAAELYDYPFLGIPNSGGALAMFQAVLDERRRTGLPHLTTNSYGFVGVPPRESAPHHEIYDIDHPLHRKIREVVASGAPCFFAAGNCGENCPSGKCLPSGIGPGRSIHASNSLTEVITVAAVNSRHERIGYSSQGPGMFDPQKPDVAAYSHFFGNFGPGRPAGTSTSAFDNGTSAATPLAAGVAALLMSSFGPIAPDELKEALVAGALDTGVPGRDADVGRGVINAAASHRYLAEKLRGAVATG
jgi:subtilisin family serine protease